MAPTIGPSRTAEALAAPLTPTIATDLVAPWLLIVDQRHMHKSEAWVRLVARACGIEEDLGEKAQRGRGQSRPTRAECLSDVSHRIRCMATPKPTSWLNQRERWFSLGVRRLLKRGHGPSVEDLRERILACIASFKQTLAKPFQWT